MSEAHGVELFPENQYPVAVNIVFPQISGESSLITVHVSDPEPGRCRIERKACTRPLLNMEMELLQNHVIHFNANLQLSTFMRF